MPDPADHDRIPEKVPPLPLPDFEYEDLEKQDRIGTGGDADVYRAKLDHEGYTYSVAIKEPRFEGTIQKQVLEKFQTEAETWSSLNDHDNIVSVYDWGADPLPWLALEYMDGGTLQDKIGSVDVAEALWLSGRIAEGIRYGHRHGVAHLDIKPTNVLLRDTGAGTWDYPKVSDWGLAKMLLEHSNSIEGISPTYGAPEQFAAEEYGSPDDITDVYQLGAVVYALVTGEPPFSGSSRAVMQGVLEKEPDPPSVVNSAVPTAVDEVLLKSLAKKKADRYEGVLTFRKDLDRLFEEYISGDIDTPVASTGESTASSTDEPTEEKSDQAGVPGTDSAEEDESRSNTQSSPDAPDISTPSSASTVESARRDSSSLVSRRNAIGLLGVGVIGGGGLMITQMGDQTPENQNQPPQEQEDQSLGSSNTEPVNTNGNWDFVEDFEEYSIGRNLADIEAWSENRREEVGFEIQNAASELESQQALGPTQDSGNWKVGAYNEQIDSWSYPENGFEIRGVLHAGADNHAVRVILDAENAGGPRMNLRYGDVAYVNFDKNRTIIDNATSEPYETRIVGKSDQSITYSYRPISESEWNVIENSTDYSGLINGIGVLMNNGGQIDRLQLRKL